MFNGNVLLKNISVLITGTVIAQIIPIAIQPILKRLYSPEVFGVFDIYLKVLGILFVIFAFKYDLGIVLPKNRIKALLLLSLSVVSSLFFTLLSLIIIFIFQDKILDLLHISENYVFIFYLLPLSTLFFALYNSFNYLLIRDKKFKASSINKINRRVVEGGIQTSVFFFPAFYNLGLFVGDLIGNFIYFISAIYQSFKTFKIDFRFFKPSLLIGIAKEYSDLPKYNIIPELLNAFFGASLSFIVLSKFSLLEVGYLESTQRILAIPSAFVSMAVGQVLLQRVSENVAENKKVLPELKMLLLLLSGMAFVFILIIYLFAPELFRIFFGEKFEVSGVYAQYLIIFFSVSFLFSPFGQVLIALKEFKINAIWQVAKFALIYSVMFFDFEDIFSLFFVYNIIGTIIYLLYGYIILKKAYKFDLSIKDLS